MADAPRSMRSSRQDASAPNGHRPGASAETATMTQRSASADVAASTAPIGPFDFRSIRLRTLIALRWLTIAGQTATVLACEFLLGVQLPLLGCAAVIGVSVWLNIVATLGSRQNQRLSERDALLTLVFDLGQLAAMLFLTGGLTNPFALFLLAPVTVAASVLSLRTTLALGAISIAAASVLSQKYVPLRLSDGAILDPPALYLVGFWVAIALGVAFQASYARRVSVEAFNMSAALTATQMALEREQRLSAIGALAAAAAHELGTPLATIKVVASELKRDLEHAPDLQADAQLISEQAVRCRRILEDLSAVRSPDDAQTRTAPISALLKEAGGPHLDRRAEIVMRLNGAPLHAAGPAQPEVARSAEIIHGLRNLIQNAVDFAASTVWIDVDTSPETISISIRDDGGGFSPDILAEIGEPFATTRGKGAADPNDAYQGMGLGVFISKTLLERSGATLSFFNAEKPARDDVRLDLDALDDPEPTGAVVLVTWPIDRWPSKTRAPAKAVLERVSDRTAPRGAAQSAEPGSSSP